MTALADTLCPECRGPYELCLVTPTRLRKQCLDCGHAWSEERSAELVDAKGYVRRDI
jgi:hypothetical protein